MDIQPDPDEFTRDAWEDNAEIWDERMGDEGNDFFNLLCWPAIASLLDIRPGRRYLDIACGNGLTSCRLAALGCAGHRLRLFLQPGRKSKSSRKPGILDRLSGHRRNRRAAAPFHGGKQFRCGPFQYGALRHGKYRSPVPNAAQAFKAEWDICFLADASVFQQFLLCTHSRRI